MTAATGAPRTAAGRDMLESYGLLSDAIYRRDPLMVRLLAERILAIEAESRGTVWHCCDFDATHGAEAAEARLAEAERLLRAVLHPDTAAMTYVTEDAIRAFLAQPDAPEPQP